MDVFFSLILVLIALAILGINGLALIGGMLGFGKLVFLLYLIFVVVIEYLIPSMSNTSI